MVVENPNRNIDKYLCKIKSFNNESFDDLIMKSVPPKHIYFKEVFWKLTKDTEFIGWFHGYFINTNLLCRDEVTMDDAWGDEIRPELQAFFSSFYDEAGRVVYPTDNMFLLDRLFINRKYRNQGFAYYLAENLPDILTRYYGYTFGYIFVNIHPLLSEEDCNIHKTNEETKEIAIKSFVIKSCLRMTNIFSSLGYQIFLDEDENDFCFLSKEFSLNPGDY